MPVSYDESSPHSVRFRLDRTDWAKVWTGFLVALVGAVATFLTDLSTQHSFGVWSPFVTVALSVVVNALRKWLANHQPVTETPTRRKRARSKDRSRETDRAEATNASAGTDRTSKPRKRTGQQARPAKRSGRSTESLVLILIAVLLAGLSGWGLLQNFSESVQPQPGPVPHADVPLSDREAVTGALVLQRQLFARICLEAATRIRDHEITSEEAENAWCQPRWAAARKEAFALLADARDRQLADGWSVERAADGLEAWARVADPNLFRE